MNKSESKYFNTALLMDEALLQLLERKDLEFITVKEICERAGVNRSTFYLHYESISDLVQETVEMIDSRFQACFDGIMAIIRRWLAGNCSDSVDMIASIIEECVRPESGIAGNQYGK